MSTPEGERPSGKDADLHGPLQILRSAPVGLPLRRAGESPRMVVSDMVFITVLDALGQTVMMSRTFRTNVGAWSWELPGGAVRPTEEPVAAGRRHLEAVAGYRVRSLELVLRFRPIIESVDTSHHLFFARGAQRIDGPGTADEVMWVPLRRVRSLIDEGLISSGSTLVALLSLLG